MTVGYIRKTLLAVGFAAAFAAPDTAPAYEPAWANNFHAKKWGFFRSNFAYGDTGPITTAIYQIFNVSPAAGSGTFWVFERVQPRLNKQVLWADGRFCQAVDATMKAFGALPSISVKSPFNTSSGIIGPADDYSEGLGVVLNARAAFNGSRFFGQVELDAGPESPLAQTISKADEKLRSCWREVAPAGGIRGMD